MFVDNLSTNELRWGVVMDEAGELPESAIVVEGSTSQSRKGRLEGLARRRLSQ